jgi:hypothetical protein
MRRNLLPLALCVFLAGFLALGVRTVAVAQGAASVKPIEAASAARSYR